jgi:hypothetical protein
MRSYLDNDFEMTEDVRHDLSAAVDLLETVCAEIEDSAPPV